MLLCNESRIFHTQSVLQISQTYEISFYLIINQYSANIILVLFVLKFWNGKLFLLIIPELLWVDVHMSQAFNVLRYEIGQKYDSHYDAFNPSEYGPQSSQRVQSCTWTLSLRACLIAVSGFLCALVANWND